MLPGSVTESRSLLVHLDYLGQTKVSYILLKDDQLCKYHILTRPTKHWFVQLVNVTHLNTIPLGRWSAPCSHHITLLLGLHLHKQTHLSDYNFRKTHKEKTPLHTVKDQDSLFLGSNYYQKQTVCKKKKTLTLGRCFLFEMPIGRRWSEPLLWLDLDIFLQGMHWEGQPTAHSLHFQLGHHGQTTWLYNLINKQKKCD